MSTDDSRLLGEQRRMRRAIGAALIAVAPLAAAGACGQSSSSGRVQRSARDAAVEDTPADGGITDADADENVSALDADADAACAWSGGRRDAAPDAAADADPGCWYQVCGLSDSGLTLIGCELYIAGPADASLASRDFHCHVRQGSGCEGDAFAPGPNGELTIDCRDCLGGGGRRPEGLEEPSSETGDSALAAYFRRMAHDEAASVIAFARMRDELSDWNAPAPLVQGAERARRDEIRHARWMERLAEQHGARVPRPAVRHQVRRSLESMARENVVEGCVHETYGALLLAWQARFAPDPSLRKTFAGVAADEARHAALSWAVARWAHRRLDAGARRRVLCARQRALSGLHARLLTTAARPFDEEVGLPDRGCAVRLLEVLAGQLS